MAKKQDLLKSFSSGSRKNKPALSEENINKIAEERAAERKQPKVQAVPEPEPVATPTPPKTQPARKQVEKKEEEVIKTSLDMPVGIYEDMKIYLIRQKKSMRQYLLELIEKDLRNKK